MSCYNCAKSYTLFNREHACPQCGFGFCGNCLQNKVPVLPGSGKEALVCRACYKTLTQPANPPRLPGQKSFSSSSTSHSFLDRSLDNLQTPPPSNPITVYQENQKMKQLRQGLSEEDRKIADRLEQLHRDRKACEKFPSDQEMAERLAKLKGLPEEESPGPSSSGAAAFVPPDTRPAVARADDLMKQMGEEIAVDKHGVDPAEDIATRLANLRGITGRQPANFGAEVANGDELDELPSDEEADNIVERIMEEQRLERGKNDAAAAAAGPSADELLEQDLDEPPPIDRQMIGLVRQLTRELKEDEEFPWCTICNEDASLRCKECDGDLYCKRCFRECHSEFEMDHKCEPYAGKTK